MAETTQLQGVPELRANFAAIRVDQQGRVSRLMVAAAAQAVKKEAKALAAAHGLRRTGALIQNIAIKRETQGLEPGQVQYNLGVRHGRDLTRKQKQSKFLAVNKKGRVVTRYRDDPFYWHFAEFGTHKQAATPYLSTALNNRKDAAVQAMAQRLVKSLQKYGV